MYQDLKGKVALITGAGRRNGIGFAVGDALAACGAKVILTDLAETQDCAGLKSGNKAELLELRNDLVARYHPDIWAFDLDVTNPLSVAGLVERVKAGPGRVDVLVNNAGATFGVPSPIHQYDDDAWFRTIDVCLHSVFRVSKAVIPLMGQGGSIINTASRAGKYPPAYNGAYAVAKAGVIMLTKVMAKEIAGLGIRVNAVCPGQIMTDLERWRFNLEAKIMGCTSEDRENEMCKTIPMGRIGTPAEAAAVIAFLASSQSSYLTGQAVNICGGQTMEL